MPELLMYLRVHDERVLLALTRRRRPGLDRGVRALTHLADAVVATGLALALALGVVPALRHAGRVALFALVVSHLMVQLVKRTVARQRPRLPVGMTSLIDAPDRFSFPSGHAAAALSLALPLAAALGPVLGTGVLGLGLLVGLSRCYLGVHYPGDVAAGWALAAAGWLLAGPALHLFAL